MGATPQQCSACGEQGHNRLTCGADQTVSRQRRWQRRKLEAGSCRICGRPQVIRGLCARHREAARVAANERRRVGK